jgi:hypothetical protein
VVIREWWREATDEIYWLEITDRPDIGTDLKAPQRRDDGSEFWGYSLITHAGHGDIVFHYRRQQHAIVAWSRIAGGWWEDDIIWAAHGTTARGLNVSPYKRSGWKVGLTDHQELDSQLTLAAIREHTARVLAIEEDLERQYGKILYLAFNRYGGSLRPQQGYLTKLPYAIVQLFPTLQKAAKEAAATAAAGIGYPHSSSHGSSGLVAMVSDRAAPRLRAQTGPGVPYRPADELVSSSSRDPMFPDPALIERGNRGHAIAQNMLAKRLLQLGLRPLSPRAGEPNYDIAWTANGILWVGEVKSLTNANEEQQLRLALGQVLRYADLLARRGAVTRLVVMTEREPLDATWQQLCERLGVLLLWPDRLTNLGTLLSHLPAVARSPESGRGHAR